MARKQYAPQTFLRVVPKPLLKQFFEQRGTKLAVEWDKLTEQDVAPIWEALQTLQGPERDKIEGVFRDVYDLACEDGVKAIIEGGRLGGKELAAAMADKDGPYHQAMWAFISEFDSFRTAMLLFQFDNLKYWCKRSGMPDEDPNLSQQALEALAAELKTYYMLTQGRGQRCTVDSLLRNGQDHYFFAYLDDWVDTEIRHNDQGKLIPQSVRRTFENVFVFNRKEGSLELSAKGDKKVKAALQGIFGRTILGVELGEEDKKKQPYNLDLLKNRNFSLVTDPEDHVEARVRAIRLTAGGRGSRRVTLEANIDAGPKDIYDMMDKWLNYNNISLDQLKVSQVTFNFRFAAVNGRRASSLTFNVTWPNSSNLKSQREEHKLIGGKYLKRWKIDSV
jgi:hypothetical protein